MTTDEKEQKDPAVASRLERLGFKAASTKVKELSVRKRKMAVAYEHYRFVRPEKIEAFNKKLYGETKNWDGIQGYHKLAFTSISEYGEVPPAAVLDALEQAQARHCFDAFEVAYIRQVKDPILFGRITGCPDRFFIAQWDDDVKIEDILKPNEG